MTQRNNICKFTIEGDDGEFKACTLEKMLNNKTRSYVDYCYLHKPNGLCKTNTCLTKASFGIDSTATYCARHAPNNYTNIRRKKCKVLNCNIIPTFANPDKPRIKITCYKHYERNQIHTLKKCLDCRKNATHAIPNTQFKIFCANHTPQDFIILEKKTIKKTKTIRNIVNEQKNNENIAEPIVNRKVSKKKSIKENSIEREPILEIDGPSVPVVPDVPDVPDEKIKDDKSIPDDLIEYLNYSDDDINDIQMGISKVNIK